MTSPPEIVPEAAALGVHQRVEQRDVDLLAVAGLGAHVQGRRARRSVTSSEVMTSMSGTVTRTGGPSGSPIHRQQAGVALREEIDAGTSGVRPVRSEGRHPDPDDVGAMAADLLVAAAETRQRRLADVGDQHVGGLEQAGEDLLRRGLAQIEHEVALVAIEAEERRVLAVALGPEVAAVVADERLDLDDVGAEVAEQRRAVRTGQHGRHVEDADAASGPAPGEACRVIVLSTLDC